MVFNIFHYKWYTRPNMHSYMTYYIIWHATYYVTLQCMLINTTGNISIMNYQWANQLYNCTTRNHITIQIANPLNITWRYIHHNDQVTYVNNAGHFKVLLNCSCFIISVHILNDWLWNWKKTTFHNHTLFEHKLSRVF